MLAQLPQIALTLLMGLHAQRHFLGRRRKQSLTETVKAWREFMPAYLPLPRPSGRNTPWFQRNYGLKTRYCRCYATGSSN